MARLGYINDKLEIKILILYILRRLPEPVNTQVLSELVLSHEGVGYFDYIECLGELESTGHIASQGALVSITEKGERNGTAAEQSLPYSVRAKTERETLALAGTMRRNSMIRTGSDESGEGSYVSLSLSDGAGDIMQLRVLVSGAEQAKSVESAFRCNAELYYNKIMQMLTDEV